MKIIFAILAIAALASCKKDAQETTRNGNFEVEFLFEKDGCKIYRFQDARTVYFSDCRGAITSDYETRSKRGTTRHYEETLNLGHE